MSLHTVRTSKWTSLSITLIFQYGAKKTIVYHVIMVSFFFWKMIYKTLSCIYEYVYCLCFHNRTNKKLYHKSPFLLFFKELNSRWSVTLFLKFPMKPLFPFSDWFLFCEKPIRFLKQVIENEISTSIVLELRQKLLPDDKVISKVKFKSTINYFHYFWW